MASPGFPVYRKTPGTVSRGMVPSTKTNPAQPWVKENGSVCWCHKPAWISGLVPISSEPRKMVFRAYPGAQRVRFPHLSAKIDTGQQGTVGKPFSWRERVQIPYAPPITSMQIVCPSRGFPIGVNVGRGKGVELATQNEDLGVLSSERVRA